ncbi:MAG: spermidine synthase [Hydrogenophilales bacterium 28-61-23]|nr:MAG: spermidine synthase [Hydrogenophilales bacterium 28-61-23]
MPVAPLLLVSVFVIATCGLVYELIAGTLASYLLGDSVTQFSTIIGAYLSAMGIGSWLSRYVKRNLVGVFVQVEILVGALGGASAAMLFMLFEQVESFRVILYADVLAVGILVGIEIPLLLRILKDRFEFSDLVSRVFTFDYAGALFASILFPLLLVPHLGLIQTGFLFGMMNVLVALWLLYAAPDAIPGARWQRGMALAVLLALLAGFIHAEDITGTAEAATYPGKVIHAQSTPYQRIVLTRAGQDLRLYLNGNLQFSSLDEYRYHEALVHPALASLDRPRRVLIVGGGDGLALREVWKYPSVARVDLVDLDPAMTRLFTGNNLLTDLNRDALKSPRLKIVNQDAYTWVRETVAAGAQPYDAIVIDLPDPSNYSIGKLYSLSFYRALKGLTHADTRIVVQSTSPLVARKSYWCVRDTLAAAGFQVTPYHAYVPAFGEWGFLLAGQRPWTPPSRYPEGLRYASVEETARMLHFPADMAYVNSGVQRLDNQLLVRYFDEEWGAYAGN